MKIAALNCGIEIRLFFVHLHSIMCSFFFRYEMYEMYEMRELLSTFTTMV